MLTQKQKLDILNYHLRDYYNTKTTKRYRITRGGKVVYERDNYRQAAKVRKEFLNELQAGDMVLIQHYIIRMGNGHGLGHTEFVVNYTDKVAKYAALVDSTRKAATLTRDFQRKRIYRMEQNHYREFCPGNVYCYKASLKEAERLIELIYATAGLLNPPYIHVDGRCKVYSYADHYGNRIQLAKAWGLNIRVIIHEVAHFVHKRLKDCDYIGHGKQFASIMVAMYERFLIGWQPDPIEDICSRRGVKYCEDTYILISDLFDGSINPGNVFADGKSVETRTARASMLMEVAGGP